VRCRNGPVGVSPARFTTFLFTRCGAANFADHIRIYADTTESANPGVYAQRMKARKEEKGLTWLKRDLGVDLVSNKPNTVTAPVDLTQQELTFSPHMFPGVEITDKGMAHWCGGSMGNARTLHFV